MSEELDVHPDKEIIKKDESENNGNKNSAKKLSKNDIKKIIAKAQKKKVQKESTKDLKIDDAEKQEGISKQGSIKSEKKKEENINKKQSLMELAKQMKTSNAEKQEEVSIQNSSTNEENIKEDIPKKTKSLQEIKISNAEKQEKNITEEKNIEQNSTTLETPGTENKNEKVESDPDKLVEAQNDDVDGIVDDVTPPQSPSKTGSKKTNYPSCFSKSDIKSLKSWYTKLEKLKAEVEEPVVIDDLFKLPGFGFNPLVEVVAEFVLKDKGVQTDEMPFDGFVTILSIFHTKTDNSIKRKYLLQCFDKNGDGQISRQDLTFMLSCFTPHLTSSEAESRAELLFDYFDLEELDCISNEQLIELFEKSTIHELFNMIK